MEWQRKKVAILGWGVDNQDVEPWLRKQGAKITILDEKPFGPAQGYRPFGDLTKYDVLVRSPGVYRYRPEFEGLNVTSKTKIFFDVCPCPIIGVTGTKGKGTTASLIYEMLKAGGKRVFLAGNIGKGMFDHLKKLDKDSFMVLELSSFQLIDLHKSPHIAVVLMVTAEHQDWHASPEEYVRAKTPIAKFQNSKDFVIANKDYANTVRIASMGQGQKVWVSGKDWMGKMRLRGEHNRENVVAAAAVAKILDVRYQTIEDVAKNFRGLEHRLEEVATVNGVTYFDDSFSTTPETTIAAIKAFSEPLVLIAGGSEKGSDFTELGKVISEAKNIKAVILIGLMAERIEKAITNKNIKLLRGAKNMAEIMEQVQSVARSGDVVVLSPAAASFDMFRNYKERGNQFKAAVKSLANL